MLSSKVSVTIFFLLLRIERKVLSLFLSTVLVTGSPILPNTDVYTAYICKLFNYLYSHSTFVVLIICGLASPPFLFLICF